jgi:hypothetical protein
LRIQFAPVPELITAEGTVVHRRTKKAKGAPERVSASAIDLVGFPAHTQMTVTAQWALTPALEKGDAGPVKVNVGAATIALKRGSRQQLEYRCSGLARSVAPALTTAWHSLLI